MRQHPYAGTPQFAQAAQVGTTRRRSHERYPSEFSDETAVRAADDVGLGALGFDEDPEVVHTRTLLSQERFRRTARSRNERMRGGH